MAAADTAKQAVDTAEATVKATAAKGAKAWQDGVEQASTFSGVAFKDAADKSLGALNDLNAQGKQNLEAVVASVTAATRGAETLGAQGLAYTKSAMEGQAEAARQITTARSMQEVIELQTNFAKSAMEAYMAQMSRTTETLSATMKDVMAPISARATAAMETVQAAR